MDYAGSPAPFSGSKCRNSPHWAGCCFRKQYSNYLLSSLTPTQESVMKFLVASLLEVRVVWYIDFVEGTQNDGFDD